MKKVTFAAVATLVAMCQFGCDGGWKLVHDIGVHVLGAINTLDSFNLFPLGLP
jgi:hypothetical protein